tara:strand:- start:472 stop:663 length:192 start_codon:yes stop_codon:yes gene_type:complete
MLDKTGIIIFILSILLLFYIVISWGARSKKKTSQSNEIKRYLFGVRILIIFIAVVGIILTFFL